MDANEKMANRLPSVRARKGHIVLLILSCVFLLIALKGARDLLEMFLLPDAPLADGTVTPNDEGTGMGIFVALLGTTLRGVALAILLVGFVPYLCAGEVLSVILCARRRDKPAWLWGISLGMAIAFGLIATGLIAVWILV